MKRKSDKIIYAHAWCHVCRHLLEVRVAKRWDITVLVCPQCDVPRDVLSHGDYRVAGAIHGKRYIPKAV
jgi:hypothetical protein